ncbi:MAG: fibronectin type III domain-containing protein [Saprospiraceae bacterium]
MAHTIQSALNALFARVLLLGLLWAGFSGTLAAQCSQPSNLNASNLTPTSVELSWSAISGATSYTLQYRPNGVVTWTTVTALPGTSTTLTGLAESTVYRWRVRASCSSYSSQAVFNSGGGGNNSSCSQPSNLNVQNLTPTSVALSWSASGGAFNYTVEYRPSGAATWTAVGPITGLTTTLSGLAASTVYQWRVKSSCSSFSSIAVFNSGGGGGNTSCSQPSNLDALNLTATSVQLSWSAIQDAFNYRVQYRVMGTTAWTTSAPLTATTLTLTGLLANTEYQWRVKASCSTYSSIAVFNTGANGGGGSSCSAPSNTNTVAVLPSSAQIEWEPVGGALDYTVEYKLLLASTYTSAGTFTVANATLTGLTPGQEYVWRVKASCSPFGSDVQFSTPTSKPGAVASGRAAGSQTADFSVFPNPAQGGTATVRANEAGSLLQIMDATGRTVLRQNMNEAQETLDLSGLKNGVYFVRLQQAGQRGATLRLVVAN